MKTLTPEQRAELVNAGWTPPKTRVIDWSRVACHVPAGILRTPESPWRDIVFRPGHALLNRVWVPGYAPTLETGLWVVNVDGTQPVPDGVLVDVWSRGHWGIDDPIRGKMPHRAQSCYWNLRGIDGDIIAFRVVGLAEGYSYE